MSTIALVGVPRTEHTLTEAIVQARIRGWDVLVLDRAEHLAKTTAAQYATYLLAVGEMTVECIVDVLRPHRIDAVLSFTEFTSILAARVRRALELPGLTPEVEESIRNKAATRSILQQYGLSTTRYQIATFSELPRLAACFPVPLVIKPLDLTGSIGVYAIRNHDEVSRFSTIVVDIEKERLRNRNFLIEQFINGREYSVEGICLAGCFNLLAITEKYTTGFPNFVETGHTLPASLDCNEEAICEYLQEVVSALKIGTAPIHAEVMVAPGTIELVEIHTRFGGDYIPLLMEMAFGFKPFGMFYDALFTGQRVRRPQARCIAGVQFLDEKTVLAMNEMPMQWRDISYRLVVEKAESADSASLDNLHVPRRRIAHLLFEASNHETAKAFVSDMVKR